MSWYKDETMNEYYNNINCETEKDCSSIILVHNIVLIWTTKCSKNKDNNIPTENFISNLVNFGSILFKKI